MSKPVASALTPAVFQILVALADQDRHGYAIIQEVAARTDGRLRLSPGTLYSNLKRLLDSRMIRERMSAPVPEEDDPRRRYYSLTARGRRAAEAELARLEEMVRQARAHGLRSPGEA